MGRKRKDANKKPAAPRPNEDWVITEELKIHGRIVTKNTELTIEGQPGRYRFVRHVLNPKNGAEWVDVVGGPKGYSSSRSYRPDRIKRVHWKNKTGENLAAERKEFRKASREEQEQEQEEE